MTANAMEVRSDEYGRLEMLAGDSSLAPERRRVARILLAYASGKTSAEVALANEMSASRARFWRKQFQQHGMAVFDAGFSSEPRRGPRQAVEHTVAHFPDGSVEQLRSLEADALDDDRRKRLRILLAYADGRSTAEIAAEEQLSPSRTRFWRTAFIKQGMKIFTDGTEEHAEQQPRRKRRAPSAPDTAPDADDKSVVRPPKKRLEARCTFAEAARLVLAKPFNELRKMSKHSDLGADPEVVHRMRVATRRMRSAFVLFDGAFDVRTVAPLVKGLKRLARLLGRVRDRDVLLMHLLNHISTLDEDARRTFMPLYDIWEQEQAAHMAALREHISSNRYESFLTKLTDFLTTPGYGDASEPLNASGIPLRAGTLAPQLILQRYGDILAFEPFLPTATLDLLHSLRIHCKKLRYTIEFFRDILGEGTAALLQRVVAMQDLLGEIQDAQTAGQLITEFVDTLERRQLDVTFIERINPAPLLHYLALRQARKHELLASVEPAWQQLTDLAFREHLLRVLLGAQGTVTAAVPFSE